MRVILVTENLGSGGAERQLVGLAGLLKGAGYEPVVVTWLDKNFHASYLAEHKIEHVLLRPQNKLDRVIKLARIFRSLQPQAVISYLPMANETCALASVLSPVKLIISERSFTTDWGLRRKLTNFLYRRAEYLVANSTNESENIKKHCPRLAHKVSAIPNFVDLSKFKQEDRLLDTNRKIIRFVGVGRVIPSKNLLKLAGALSNIISLGFNVELKWYGDTYDKTYLKELKTVIAEEGLENNFLIMGENHNISKAYAEADYFVMPSKLEGYPNVLVEAMASGLPVACSAVCEHPYIVTDGENGFLFNPESIEEITSAIERLCRLSSDDYERISKNNSNFVISNNSPEYFLKKYLGLIMS